AFLASYSMVLVSDRLNAGSSAEIVLSDITTAHAGHRGRKRGRKTTERDVRRSAAAGLSPNKSPALGNFSGPPRTSMRCPALAGLLSARHGLNLRPPH